MSSHSTLYPLKVEDSAAPTEWAKIPATGKAGTLIPTLTWTQFVAAATAAFATAGYLTVKSDSGVRYRIPLTTAT